MRKRSLGSMWQWSLALVLAAVLLLNLTLLYRQFRGKEPLPKVGGYGFTVVLTGSMLPDIAPGDLLVVREQTQYTVDDIVTFHNGQSLVTHRIIGVEEGGLRTKGDNNNVADAKLVALSQVQGRVVMRVPYLGRTVLFLRQPLGILFLAVLGIVIIEWPYFRTGRHAK